MVGGLCQKLPTRHQRRGGKAIADALQDLVFGQTFPFHGAGLVPGRRQQNVGKLVKQRKNPSVRCVSVVQQNHRQWAVRNAGPSHFDQRNIPGLENQDALPFDGRAPCVQCGIRSVPRKLGFPRNAERLTDALTDNFFVFIWIRHRLTFRNRLAQRFVEFARNFAAEQGHAERQPKFRGFGLRRHAGQAAELTLRVEALRGFGQKKDGERALVSFTDLSELSDGRKICALFPPL